MVESFNIALCPVESFNIALCLVESFNIAKNCGSCQPVWIAQADMGRNKSQIHKSRFLHGVVQNYIFAAYIRRLVTRMQ